MDGNRSRRFLRTAVLAVATLGAAKAAADDGPFKPGFGYLRTESPEPINTSSA